MAGQRKPLFRRPATAPATGGVRGVRCRTKKPAPGGSPPASGGAKSEDAVGRASFWMFGCRMRSAPEMKAEYRRLLTEARGTKHTWSDAQWRNAVDTVKRSRDWGIQAHGGSRRTYGGPITPASGGTPSKPAIGDTPTLWYPSAHAGSNALAAGNDDHDKAMAVGGVEPAAGGMEPAAGGVEPAAGGVEPAVGGVDNAKVVVDLGYRLLGKSIGHGSYGTVFPVMWKNGSSEAGSELAVVKHIELCEARSSDTADREVEILMQLRHPYVIRLIQAIQTPFAKDLIFEHCSCDLRAAIKLEHDSGGDAKFTLEPFERITRQLCIGLAYLHEKEIVHRDLKPANVMVRQMGSSVIVKIGDFGLARRVPRERPAIGDMPATGGDSAGPPHMTTGVTTLWYMAPEMLLGSQHYDTAVDMWALGCVCVEFEGKVVAFPGSNEESMITKILSTMSTQPAPGGSPWMALGLLPKYIQVVKSMGRRKGRATMTLPWLVKGQCEEFLKKVFIPCPSLRFCAKDALTLPYLLATGSCVMPAKPEGEH